MGGLDWILVPVPWVGLSHYRAKYIENKPALDTSTKRPITSISGRRPCSLQCYQPGTADVTVDVTVDVTEVKVT